MSCCKNLYLCSALSISFNLFNISISFSCISMYDIYPCTISEASTYKMTNFLTFLALVSWYWTDNSWLVLGVSTFHICYRSNFRSGAGVGSMLELLSLLQCVLTMSFHNSFCVSYIGLPWVLWHWWGSHAGLLALPCFSQYQIGFTFLSETQAV